jgi:hypothetical protein
MCVVLDAAHHGITVGHEQLFPGFDSLGRHDQGVGLAIHGSQQTMVYAFPMAKSE